MIDLLITTLVLWLFFIATAKIAGDAEQLSDLPPLKALFVAAFVFFDVLYNFTYGSILFLQLPSLRRGEKTLTARLKNILLSGKFEGTWRYRLAKFMCKKMISPWDWNHCGMGYGDK